jgi:membrane-bound serine protease (ClpP class)
MEGKEGGQGGRKFVDDEQFKKLMGEGWKPVAGAPDPVDAADTLLTVHTDLALKLGLAKGTAGSVEELAERENLRIIQRYRVSVGEQVVSFLLMDAVRGILLTVFLMSLYAALHTPGQGAAEALTVVSLGLLLGVPFLAGYATWVEILLILGGLSLLAFEIFVFPGTLAAGIVGAVMIVAGLVLTFVGSEPGGGWTWELRGTWQAMQAGLMVVVISMLASLAGMVWLRRILPRVPYFNRLILSTNVGESQRADRFSPPLTATPVWPPAGMEGVAVSDLKPGGQARFVDDRGGRFMIAVISDSGYIHRDTAVVVRENNGSRVTVCPK